MRTAEWTNAISVLDRVTAVFDALGEHDDGLGVSEVARRANLPKSTVSRIASELVAQRLLDRDGDKLYLGVRLFEFGQTVPQPRRLRRLALPLMTELRNATGHTVQLAILEGRDVVFVANVRGASGPKPTSRTGDRAPAHATALGKAILAFSTEEALSAVVGCGLESQTSRTICDPTVFARHLVEIRLTGVAVEREECVADRVSVASPVLTHGSLAVAAVAVVGSPDDLACDRVSAAVRAAAITIGHRLDADPGR